MEQQHIRLLSESVPNAVRYYLDRTGELLKLVSQENDAPRLLANRLAPDMFDTGFNFAVAIRLAARSLCPPAGLNVPEIPEDITCETLLGFAEEIAGLIRPIRADDLREIVCHQAGQANLTQSPADYVTHFAIPNMIFHLSIAYAGLRQGGMKIGKANFDGFHMY